MNPKYIQLIERNWEVLQQVVQNYIVSERKTAYLKFLEDWSEQLVTAPASSRKDFHNCFPGGYLDHILNVVDAALKVHQLYQSVVENDYTSEELVFAALNHDLGKLGEKNKPYYLEETSKWHLDKGSLYKKNLELDFMTVPDRSIYILSTEAIPFSRNEYLAIKLHDGLFDEANKEYLAPKNPDNTLKTYLPIVLHQADYLACLLEKRQDPLAKLK